MATMERAGDEAPPHGIPRPQWLVRFFDEHGAPIGTRRFMDAASAEECAVALLGTDTAHGTTVCLARFFIMDDGGELIPGGELEY